MSKGRLLYALGVLGVAAVFFVGGWLVHVYRGPADSFRVSPGVYSNISLEGARDDRIVLVIEGRGKMQGMVCDGCARRVHEALLGVPGVTAARVDLKTQEAEVIADTARVTAAELIRAVNDADFGALLKGSS